MGIRDFWRSYKQIKDNKQHVSDAHISDQAVKIFGLGDVSVNLTLESSLNLKSSVP